MKKSVLGLKTILAIVMMAFVTPSFAAAGSSELLNAEEMMPKLQKGGIIIVIRHQRAAIEGRWDDFTRPWSECSAQRNLSPAGYAGALETGVALRILDIKVDKVLASPTCRTMETARLIFGTTKATEGLAHITVAKKRSAKLASRELKDIIDGVESNTENVVLVTHGGNILEAFGVLLSEGDMIFFEHISGKPVLIGRAAAVDFDLFANAHLINK